MFRRNISKTPDLETEMAALFMMDFYVPAQSSAEIVGPVDNYILDDDLGTAAYEARDFAKPLISVYIDGEGTVNYFEEGAPVTVKGGMSFGAFDAFAGVSLDDGTSWKTTNLSNSAHQLSFLVDGKPYAGSVHHMVHQVAGNQIFAAWASRYCDGGQPLFKQDLVDNLDC